MDLQAENKSSKLTNDKPISRLKIISREQSFETKE